MTKAGKLPSEELARLGEIGELGLTSSEVDDVLQELTREAAATTNLPIALVSIVTDNVQYFAAAHGLEGWIAEARGTPKEWSFCQHAVNDKATFVVEDAADDERVQTSPLVTQDGIRCYLGVPLQSSKGTVLGTLCVVGAEPRHFSADDQRKVEALARRAMERIETRRIETRRNG